MVVTAVLLAFLIVAAGTDIREHKIYNWTTYPGMVAALALNAWCDRAGLPADAGFDWWGGVELSDSLAGFFVCGFCMVVCYALFHIGGGDVKLIAMVGAFLGLEAGIVAMLWTIVLGAAAVIVWLIWRFGTIYLLIEVGRRLWSRARYGFWPPLAESEQAVLKLPLFLAPSALVAVLVVRYPLFIQWWNAATTR